jgi:hypothetical protein
MTKCFSTTINLTSKVLPQNNSKNNTIPAFNDIGRGHVISGSEIKTLKLKVDTLGAEKKHLEAKLKERESDLQNQISLLLHTKEELENKLGMDYDSLQKEKEKEKQNQNKATLLTQQLQEEKEKQRNELQKYKTKLQELDLLKTQTSMQQQTITSLQSQLTHKQNQINNQEKQITMQKHTLTQQQPNLQKTQKTQKMQKTHKLLKTEKPEKEGDFSTHKQSHKQIEGTKSKTKSKSNANSISSSSSANTATQSKMVKQNKGQAPSKGNKSAFDLANALAQILNTSHGSLLLTVLNDLTQILISVKNKQQSVMVSKLQIFIAYLEQYSEQISANYYHLFNQITDSCVQLSSILANNSIQTPRINKKAMDILQNIQDSIISQVSKLSSPSAEISSSVDLSKTKIAEPTSKGKAKAKSGRYTEDEVSPSLKEKERNIKIGMNFFV